LMIVIGACFLLICPLCSERGIRSNALGLFTWLACLFGSLALAWWVPPPPTL
jgi:hypothetical protein